jgi:H+/Cl- antiporter ClcA
MIVLCAGIGFAVGMCAEFVYLNLDTIERLAAETDGFGRWSRWQLLFALPGGIAGALLGGSLMFLLHSLDARKRRKNPPL